MDVDRLDEGRRTEFPDGPKMHRARLTNRTSPAHNHVAHPSPVGGNCRTVGMSGAKKSDLTSCANAMQWFISMMKLRVLLLLWGHFALGARLVAADVHLSKDMRPSELWNVVLQNRAAIHACDLLITVERHLVEGDGANNELDGSKLHYHLFLDGDRVRADLNEARPRNPSDASDSRFAFADGVYRYIPRHAQAAVHEIHDITRTKHDRPGNILHHVWIDPRLVGLWPTRFQSLADLTLGSLAGLPQYLVAADVIPTKIGEQDALILNWEYPKNNAKRQFTINPSIGYVPIKVEATSNLGTIQIRDSIECAWESYSDPASVESKKLLLPSRAEYRRHEGGGLVAHETWIFNRVESVNQPIEESVFQWPALDLWPGAVLVRGEGGGREIVQWNGSDFEPWTATPLAKVLKPSDRASRLPLSSKSSQGVSVRHIIVWANIAVGIACLLYVVWRKFRSV